MKKMTPTGFLTREEWLQLYRRNWNPVVQCFCDHGKNPYGMFTAVQEKQEAAQLQIAEQICTGE